MQISRLNQYNNLSFAAIPQKDVGAVDSNNKNTSAASQPLRSTSVSSFGANRPLTLNTTLRTQEEQKKFIEVASALNKNNKAKLSILLTNGRLLSDDANDKSTTLDNLHNILTNNRVQGLESKSILNDVVTALANPYAITQRFGDIPEPIAKDIIANSDKFSTSDTPYTNYLESIKKAGKMPVKQPITKEDLNVASSSCVAASIQFNLAHKSPAEYARMAEQLSSDKMSVTKKLKLSDIAPGDVDALWLLNQFKVPYRQLDWDNIQVKMAPDRNAIIRARVQASSKYKDPGERSPIDVLMQSTFMNIGSQHTYNALTDVRTGLFNPDNRGLTDVEKNLTEVIAEGKNKISVTYQILDDTGKIVGYECPHEETLKHIKSALSAGENVIVGYTHTDSNNRVVNGHEITIVGIEKNKNGSEVFVCNDTDDNKDEPVRYNVDYLLPKIHHAGLPKTSLAGNVQIIDSWVDVLNQYKASLAA